MIYFFQCAGLFRNNEKGIPHTLLNIVRTILSIGRYLNIVLFTFLNIVRTLLSIGMYLNFILMGPSKYLGQGKKTKLAVSTYFHIYG